MFWKIYLIISIITMVYFLLMLFIPLLSPKTKYKIKMMNQDFSKGIVKRAIVFWIIVSVLIGFTWIVSLPYLLFRWLFLDDEED